MDNIWNQVDSHYDDIIQFAKEFTDLEKPFYDFLEETKNKKEDLKALYDCLFLIWDKAPDIVEIHFQNGFLDICDILDVINEK
jgi:hypothetical protein